MKSKSLISIVLFLVPAFLPAQEIVTEFPEVDNYTDFSVNGLSEEKTLKIFQAEFDEGMERAVKKYLKEGETLKITFTDIDMAGDIQPWRNRHNADIRYVQDVYPPRLKFSFVLEDGKGKVLDEGEASINDISFQMNTLAPMRVQYRHFFYETNLLSDWMRKTFRKRD